MVGTGQPACDSELWAEPAVASAVASTSAASPAAAAAGVSVLGWDNQPPCWGHWGLPSCQPAKAPCLPNTCEASWKKDVKDLEEQVPVRPERVR